MAEGEFSNTLQQEIAQLEQALASKKEKLEQQKTQGEIAEVPAPKEILRQVIGEKLAPTPSPGSTSSPQASSGQASTPTPLPPPTVEPPSYLSPALKEQVQQLINTAFTKSLDDALQQARAADNPALLDAFHDALTDELYDQLVERGQLKSF